MPSLSPINQAGRAEAALLEDEVTRTADLSLRDARDRDRTFAPTAAAAAAVIRSLAERGQLKTSTSLRDAGRPGEAEEGLANAVTTAVLPAAPDVRP